MHAALSISIKNGYNPQPLSLTRFQPRSTRIWNNNSKPTILDKNTTPGSLLTKKHNSMDRFPANLHPHDKP